MSGKQQQKRIQSILTDVRSGDEKKVSRAIKSLEANGDPSVIRPLAELLLEGISPKNEGEILELFSSLKDTGVTAEIMDVIEAPSLRPIRQKMLTTIWNMKVDFSDYLDEFVQIATQGDFMEALDCLTIIENLEGPFMEENVLECQLHLKNYLEGPTEKDAQKAQIISEIAVKIKDINENLNDLGEFDD